LLWLYLVPSLLWLRICANDLLEIYCVNDPYWWNCWIDPCCFIILCISTDGIIRSNEKGHHNFIVFFVLVDTSTVCFHRSFETVVFNVQYAIFKYSVFFKWFTIEAIWFLLYFWFQYFHIFSLIHPTAYSTPYFCSW